MNVGDSVMYSNILRQDEGWWDRCGLVLGFHYGQVLIFWGEDYPAEEEYPDDLEVV